MVEITDRERKLIRLMSGGIPMSERPFRDVAVNAGLTENEVLSSVAEMVTSKKIRRVAAVLRHREIGYHANGMCVFRVGTERIDAAGEYAAGLSSVSHCYSREIVEGWPYNLYAMAHAATREECLEIAAGIAAIAKTDDYMVLFSVRELKKKNAAYF